MDVHIPTAPSFNDALLVPKVHRAVGVTACSNVCQELRQVLILDNVLIGFTTPVTLSETLGNAQTKSR